VRFLQSETIRSLSGTAAYILLLAVLASIGARFFWLTDLFSHFLIQYIVGAIILAPLCYLQHRKCLSLFLCTALIFCLFKITALYTKNTHLEPLAQGPTFTVVHFNKLVSNDDYDAIQRWLIKNKDRFDLVILQEADIGLKTIADNLKEFYPNQLIRPEKHAFGTAILGKKSLISIQPFKMDEKYFTNTAYELEIHANSVKHPIKLYSFHAIPPTSPNGWEQRNSELQVTSLRIKEDKNPNIIAMGDWNITPYSPFFDDFVKKSGLHYYLRPYFPETTWPDKFKIPLFQIPIDHILFSDGLLPIEKEVGPALGSDHRPVIMTFVENN